MTQRLAILLLLLLAGSALAAVDTPPPEPGTADWLAAIYSAVVNGEWKIVAGLGLSMLAFALRTWGTKLIPWFGTKLGGTTLLFAASLAATFSVTLSVGAKITLATVLTAISTAAAAAGIWEWVKSLLPGVAASNEATKAKASS
jgi:hypothetical protein